MIKMVKVCHNGPEDNTVTEQGIEKKKRYEDC